LVPRVRKGVVQIRFEILEFLYYHTTSQIRTYIWRKATILSSIDRRLDILGKFFKCVTGCCVALKHLSGLEGFQDEPC